MRVESKHNSKKVILFYSLQLLLKSLNDDDAWIAAQVELKTSILKSL